MDVEVELDEGYGLDREVPEEHEGLLERAEAELQRAALTAEEEEMFACGEENGQESLTSAKGLESAEWLMGQIYNGWCG